MATPAELESIRQKIAQNPALLSRLAKYPSLNAAVPELVAMAKEFGVQVTDDEVRSLLGPGERPKGELSDAELAGVAGGTKYCWGTDPMCWNTDPI